MDQRTDPERALDALLDEVKSAEVARPTPEPAQFLLRLRQRLNREAAPRVQRPRTVTVAWSLAAALLLGLALFLVVDGELTPADRLEDELVELLADIDDLDPSQDGLQALIDQLDLDNYSSVLESPLVEELGSS